MEDALQCASELQAGSQDGNDPLIESGWVIDDKLLRPGDSFTASSCSWQAENVEDDVVIRFAFHDFFNYGYVLIHTSRLRWAGGPFAALVRGDFVERMEKSVNLSTDDSPLAFSIIRNYLYLKTISLDDATLETLLRTMKAAHRWQLPGLFRLLREFSRVQDLLPNVAAVCSAKDVVVLPGISERFKSYFWDRVANLFDAFSPKIPTETGTNALTSKGNNADTSRDVISSRSCPLFPELWSLAVSQGVVRNVMQKIKACLKKKLNETFLEVAMVCLEPQIDDNDEVFDMLCPLVADCLSVDSFLRKASISNLCSSRALLLFARALTPGMYPVDHASYSFSFRLNSFVDKTFTFWTGKQLSRGNGYHNTPRCDLSFITESKEEPLHVKMTTEATNYEGTARVTVFIIENECFCQERKTGASDSAHDIVDTMKYDFTNTGWNRSKELSLGAFRERHEVGSKCTLRLNCRAVFIM